MSWFESIPTRERRETREAWERADAALRETPIHRDGLAVLSLALLGDVQQVFGRLPRGDLLEALLTATIEVFEREGVGVIAPNWASIDGDLVEGVNFRRLAAHRQRWGIDFRDRYHRLRVSLVRLWITLLTALPESCFEELATGPPLAEVPLIELVHQPEEVVHAFSLFPFASELQTADLAESLRELHGRNALMASGFPAHTEMASVRQRLKLPRDSGLSPAELVASYLQASPFGTILTTAMPFVVPDDIRFEHTHILGGTGHGKTQLLQRMIFADLTAAQSDGRSVVVIDSQGDLIAKLSRLDLFDGASPHSLADRLVLIDPTDIEHPASLNLFDPHLARLSDYRPVDRERVLNGAVELYETFFGDLLGAELTQKQGVVFRYLARLMVTIPGATISTLMELMEDGHAFKPYMRSLEGSSRRFFETEFFHPSFTATKKQVLRRLWGVLSTPAFERMFVQAENKIDLFEATRTGKIILISTAKDLLKRDGSALLGRFFINLLAQAALERSVLPEGDRTPTFVYVDEAQEYFDEGIETILAQARKYRIGIIAAHQSLDQASPKLRAALFSNTSFKCAGGVSARDARALADELRTSAEFIESVRRRRDRTEFAAWVKNRTPSAVRLTVPLGFLERQPTLTEEAFDDLIDRNRARYCGTPTQAPSATLSARARDDQQVDAPVFSTVDEVPFGRVAELARQIGPGPSPVRELGKGGKKHRYLQSLVKGLAEEQGFRATIEAPFADRQVDVLLERDDQTIAVEVSVTTPVDWERENIRRCLSESAGTVVLVLAKSARTSRTYREAIMRGLPEELLDRLVVLQPEEVADFLAGQAPPQPPPEAVVKGYRVKVSRTDLPPDQVRARRDLLAKLVSKALR